MESDSSSTNQNKQIAMEKFMSMSQEGTIDEYCDEFRFLLNKVKVFEEISEDYATYLFIFGLESAISDILMGYHNMGKGLKLEQAISLARLQEGILNGFSFHGSIHQGSSDFKVSTFNPHQPSSPVIFNDDEQVLQSPYFSQFMKVESVHQVFEEMPKRVRNDIQEPFNHEYESENRNQIQEPSKEYETEKEIHDLLGDDESRQNKNDTSMFEYKVGSLYRVLITQEWEQISHEVLNNVDACFSNKLFKNCGTLLEEIMKHNHRWELGKILCVDKVYSADHKLDTEDPLIVSNDVMEIEKEVGVVKELKDTKTSDLVAIVIEFMAYQDAKRWVMILGDYVKVVQSRDIEAYFVNKSSITEVATSIDQVRNRIHVQTSDRSTTRGTWHCEHIVAIQSVKNRTSNSYSDVELPPKFDRVGIGKLILTNYKDKRWVAIYGRPNLSRAVMKFNNLSDASDVNLSLDISFLCQSNVKIKDDYKQGGQSLCVCKFYHTRYLARKQLCVYDPFCGVIDMCLMLEELNNSALKLRGATYGTAMKYYWYLEGSFNGSIPLHQFLSPYTGFVKTVFCSASCPINNDILQYLPELRFVVTSSAGIDHIDLHECKQRGLKVANAGSIFSEDVADAAVCLLIDVLRRISAADRLLSDSSSTKKLFDFDTFD